MEEQGGQLLQVSELGVRVREESEEREVGELDSFHLSDERLEVESHFWSEESLHRLHEVQERPLPYRTFPLEGEQAVPVRPVLRLLPSEGPW